MTNCDGNTHDLLELEAVEERKREQERQCAGDAALEHRERAAVDELLLAEVKSGMVHAVGLERQPDRRRALHA